MELRRSHDDRVKHVDNAALVNEVIEVHEEFGKSAKEHLGVQQNAQLSERRNAIVERGIFTEGYKVRTRSVAKQVW